MKTKNRLFVLIFLSFIFIFNLFACNSNSENHENENIIYNNDLCTINFKNVDNSQVMPSTKIKKGNLLCPPKEPIKEDFIFAGWFKDKEFNEEWPFEKSIENNVTLYAKWDNLIIYCDSLSQEYKRIIKPLEDFALFMIEDLYKKDKLFYNEVNLFSYLKNPKIHKLRFFYGTSLSVLISGDKLTKDGNTSNYLNTTFLVELQNFGDHYSSEYALAQEFFKQERLLTGKSNYENVVKPLAQRTADALSDLYNSYEGTISCSPTISQIIIDNKKTEYTLIKDFLNEKILEKKIKTYSDINYQNMINKIPLLNNCDIIISFDGVNGIYSVSFKVPMGISEISIDFNISSLPTFNYDEIAYYFGVVDFGYLPGASYPTPNNSEYYNFLNNLISNLPKQFDISSRYKTEYGEDTFMNIPNAIINI